MSENIGTPAEGNSSNQKQGFKKLALRDVAIYLILCLVIIMSGGALVSSYIQNDTFQTKINNEISTARANENRQLAIDNEQKLAEQKQGQEEERKLCATLNGLAQIKAPAGNAGDNPSRAYEQEVQKKLSELAPDVGC